MHDAVLQVRFSPVDSDIMASGSLDFTAVVWQVSTGQLLYSHDFGGFVSAGFLQGRAVLIGARHGTTVNQLVKSIPQLYAPSR